jgi:hypothetical protein
VTVSLPLITLAGSPLLIETFSNAAAPVVCPNPTLPPAVVVLPKVNENVIAPLALAFVIWLR